MREASVSVGARRRIFTRVTYMDAPKQRADAVRGASGSRKDRRESDGIPGNTARTRAAF